ncbi:MAG: hypothetical protein IJ105_03650 [Bacilli bacterium]|nr:hypothetical protein [Bacilli bacterium]
MEGRNKNILLGVLIVGVISMSVAFAALSTRLQINGTTNVAATKWNIHFQNWTNMTQNTVTVSGVTHSNTAQYDDTKIEQTLAPNITKIDKVNVILKQPGDYIKYNFEIINEGTIAAALSNFTTTITNNNDNVINYEVKCYESNAREGTEVTTNSVLEPNEITYCYLKVEYKDQDNNNGVYEQSEINTNISANWIWEQGSSSSSSSGSGDSGSSSGDSGNEQSGGNEQSDDITYYYTSGGAQAQASSLNTSTIPYWIQNNNTTGVKEVCGNMNGDIVCLRAHNWDCGTLNGTSCSNSSGYVAALYNRFLQVPNVNPEDLHIDDDSYYGNVSLSVGFQPTDDQVECSLDVDGIAMCYSPLSNCYCLINADGSSECGCD